MNRDAEREAARTALTEAMAGNRDGVSAALAGINKLGGAATEFAIRAWCDTLIARKPFIGDASPGSAARLVLISHADRQVSDVDQVPAEVAWAGRIVAARAAMDLPAYEALIGALPDDGWAVGAHVMCLLQNVALNLNAIEAGTHPSRAGAPEQGAPFDEAEVRRLAASALASATARDYDAAEDSVFAIRDCGAQALGWAMLAWADTLNQRMPGDIAAAGRPVRLVTYQAGDMTPCDPDGFPPDQQWVARFLTARAANDHEMCIALAGSIPPADVADHVFALLATVAGNLEVLDAGRHPMQRGLS